MAAIAIDRLHTRYRIPAGASRAQPRLQQIVTDAVTRGFEGALDRAGVGDDGFLCIRNLQAVVRLRLREPDASLAACVGEALAEAVLAAVARTSSSVVRYRSRAAALVDMAVGALAGDFERQWAWTQIGLWRESHPAGIESAAAEIMRALATDPRDAMVVLISLARVSPEVFVRLASESTPTAWSALARTVWLAAGAPSELLESTGIERHEPSAATPPTSHQAKSFRRSDVVNWSEIARAAAGRLGHLSPPSVRAVAALAALEIDPAAAGRSRLQVLHMIASVERALSTAAASNLGLPDANSSPAVQDGKTTLARVDGPPQPGIGEPAPLESSEPSPPTVLLEPRASGPSRFGGLLYLINVAGAIGLPQIILRDERLTDRGSRWVLHQIAMRLGAGMDDPAALAFAGLGPDRQSPASLETAANADEGRAISEHRARLLGGLRAALESNDDSDDELIRFVCHRRATVVADPGWIDVELPLAELATEIRRAGLDRDPGWVPWLGVVMRFTYV